MADLNANLVDNDCQTDHSLMNTTVLTEADMQACFKRAAETSPVAVQTDAPSASVAPPTAAAVQQPARTALQATTTPATLTMRWTKLSAKVDGREISKIVHTAKTGRSFVI